MNGRSPGRYNTKGLKGLSDRRSAGPAPRLSREHKPELAQLVREGPDPAVDGVVRWRRVDFQRRIEVRFGVALLERTVGKKLAALGFQSLSVRPQHPKSNPEVQETFQKTTPRPQPTPCRITPGTTPWRCGFKTKPRGSASRAH